MGGWGGGGGRGMRWGEYGTEETFIRNDLN